MKKIIGILSLAIIVTTMSCKNDKQTETKVVKEYIVTPAPPPPPRIIVKDPPEKNTTITLDKNGVKVESKKIDVDIKKQ